MSKQSIKILIYREKELFELLTSLLKELGFNYQIEISNNEYYVCILNTFCLKNKTVDYAVVLNVDNSTLEEYINRSRLVITNTFIGERLNRVLVIEKIDSHYLLGVIISLIGIPLEYVLSKVSENKWRQVLNGYTDTMYRNISIELKRIDLKKEYY